MTAGTQFDRGAAVGASIATAVNLHAGDSDLSSTNALAAKTYSPANNGWNTPPPNPNNILGTVSQWATAILPLAHEAHERLVFGKLKPGPDLSDLRVVGTLTAVDHGSRKPEQLGADRYREWAQSEIAPQMVKGAWRLAWLLAR